MRFATLIRKQRVPGFSNMNHYERAKHWPGYGFARRPAEALNVPVAYSYALRDEEAEIFLAFHRAKKVTQDKWLAMAKEQSRTS